MFMNYTEAEEDALPVGRYMIDKICIQDHYDITTDMRYPEVETQVMLAIMEPGPLPVGVISARVRPDGNRVVRGWAMTDRAQYAVDYALRYMQRLLRTTECSKCGLFENRLLNPFVREESQPLSCVRCGHGPIHVTKYDAMRAGGLSVEAAEALEEAYSAGLRKKGSTS